MPETTPETILNLAQSSQASKRAQVPELLEKLDLEQRIPVIFELLRSPYKDISEPVLMLCQSETYTLDEKWIPAIREHLRDIHFDDGEDCENHNLPQLILVLISRLEPSALPLFRDTLMAALSAKNPDNQYQALVALENLEENSKEYTDFLINALKSPDADIRIVASQGLMRLNCYAALPALQEASRYAFGTEAFHFILARCALGDDGLEQELINALSNDALCYPAILALGQYGSERAIPRLLRIAKSWLGEPTVRVSAAQSAAILGSDEAVKLLKKFAKQHSGNPELAKSALQQLNISVE